MVDGHPEEDRETFDVPEDASKPTPTGTYFRLGVQEFARALLAFAFVGILALTLILAFENVGGTDWDDTVELLQLLLPAETALLGSAVGFYFGSRS